jgi:hypothetical protein
MKKILTMVVAVLAASSTVLAQESAASNAREKIISVGPVVGFGHSGVRNVGYDDIFKPSWNAGLTMNYSSWEHIGLSVDLFYSKEGGRYQMNNGNEIDLTLHYVRLPIKLAFFMGDYTNDFRPKFTIGPSVGFLIDDSFEVSGDGSRAGINSNFDQEDYNNIDFGGQATIGFNYKMAERIWLNVDGYYYQGLSRIDDLSHYNADFGLRAGVAFGL